MITFNLRHPYLFNKTNTYQKNNLKVFVKRIKYYLEVYLHKKYNDLFEYLYLDDLESLYELFTLLYDNKIQIKKKEFIFIFIIFYSEIFI